MGDSSLVYSTETGATCPECEKSIDQCCFYLNANPRDGLNTERVCLTKYKNRRH